jgi:periplasmic nitrate reductase NapD
MSILGVIVRARPEHGCAVQAQLAELPGLDIAAHDAGRWVVVIEDCTAASAAATMARVALLPQVLNTSLVYEYSGPDAPAPQADTGDYQAWRSSLADMADRRA